MKSLLAVTSAAVMLAMATPVLACNKGGRVQHMRSALPTPAAVTAPLKVAKPDVASPAAEQTGAAAAFSPAIPAT